MADHQPGTALVIGATGGIGGEVAAALSQRGWHLRGLARRPDEAARRSTLGGIEWVRGDAMSAADVVAAARGTSVVFHGANPARYHNWRGLALPMLQSTIAAAKACGARIVFPGTIYNYGPDAFPVLTERSPQHPLTRKGRIRVEMEQSLQAAAGQGVRSLVVRAGDFFGPSATGNSWFRAGMVSAGRPVRSISYPGPHDVGHAWAYLPDLAEAIALLLERSDRLGNFETFHFGGHWFSRGVEIAHSVRRVVGNPSLPIRRFPWWAIYAASPFVETFREMLEMRYLWYEPVRLENAKLVALLGAEPHTPIDVAVRATLEALGCLDGRNRAVAANAV
jgi:nucleoside-diphosphate-sugar epimerase